MCICGICNIVLRLLIKIIEYVFLYNKYILNMSFFNGKDILKFEFLFDIEIKIKEFIL